MRGSASVPADSENGSIVSAHVLALRGGDPFVTVLEAADRHRPQHGNECGLHPAGPNVMATAAMLVRASDARRILDLGSGFGYSALWLAHAAGPGSEVVGVDRFEEHVHEARRFAAEARLEAEITFVCGEVASVLDDLDGDFDLVHDDAWFASAPDYYEQMVTVLRPGGVLSMPNWFLMEDAVSGQPRRDWSTLAGDQWAQETIAYAERLARDPRLHVTWVVSPPLGVGIKKRTRTARGDTAR